MGCGRVGSTLARSLEDRNHTVSVIDSEPDAFRRLGADFNGDKVVGMGFDQVVLEKAGIRDSVVVMVGGAPVTQEYADAVGADGYAPDASATVKRAKDLLQKRRAMVPA